jgi:hypothetical protein
MYLLKFVIRESHCIYFSMVNLKTLPVPQTICHRMLWRFLNDKLERLKWKRPWPVWKCYYGIRLETLRKATKHLRRVSVPVEIRSGLLLNASQKRYCISRLSGSQSVILFGEVITWADWNLVTQHFELTVITFACSQFCVEYTIAYKKGQSRSWRPIGLWDVETRTFSRQLAHRWRWCQSYAPVGRPLPPGKFLVLISVTGWVDKITVRLEWLT